MKRLVVILSCVGLIGCAVAEKKERPPVAERPLTVQQQQKASLVLFRKALEVAEQKGDTPDALEERINILKEMAQEYPDAPLSKEAYWHIVNIYLNKYYPPQVEKAEQAYREFLKKFPNSPMKTPIESTLNLFYFQHEMWDRLERLHRGRIERFINTGEIDSPFYFYMYSLARMNLGDLDEAEKGFKWIIIKYPNTQPAKDARRQLDKIKELRNRRGGKDGRP